MFCALRIKITSPWLGDQKSNDKVKRFARNKDRNYLSLNINKWHWACSSAARALNMPAEMNPCDIHFPDKFKSPSLILYRRKWQAGEDERRREELFESINVGNVLYFDFFVPDQSEKDKKRAPTLKELQDMLKFIGEYIGLSPWGSRFGYGRFIVEGLAEQNPIDVKAYTQAPLHLPAEFVAAHRPNADMIKFFNHPLTMLSRDELLAALSYYMCDNLVS